MICGRVARRFLHGDDAVVLAPARASSTPRRCSRAAGHVVDARSAESPRRRSRGSARRCRAAAACCTSATRAADASRRPPRIACDSAIAFCRVVRAGAGDDGHAAARLLDGDLDDAPMFLERHRRGFAGGAAGHEEVDTLVDLPVDERRAARARRSPRRRERRRERGTAAAERRSRVMRARRGARRSEHVLHGEHPMLPDQPPRRHERALGEDASVTRFVHEAHLLEWRVEDQLVRARHRPGAHARDRNRAPDAASAVRGERSRRARGASFLARDASRSRCASNPSHCGEAGAPPRRRRGRTRPRRREKFGAVSMAPPRDSHVALQCRQAASYHPVVPTTTGQPAATHARTFAGAAVRLVNSMATSAPPSDVRVDAGVRLCRIDSRDDAEAALRRELLRARGPSSPCR